MKASEDNKYELPGATNLIPTTTPPRVSEQSNERALPASTDEARKFLVAWHRKNFTDAAFFSSYIENTLAGDFAYHLARSLASSASNQRAAPEAPASEQQANEVPQAATGGGDLPPHLLEFVQAVADNYVHHDDHKALHCSGCLVDLDAHELHKPDCIVRRARALFDARADHDAPAGGKGKAK